MSLLSRSYSQRFVFCCFFFCTGRISGKLIIDSRSRGITGVQNKYKGTDFEQPPPIPPRTPEMHHLLSTRESSSTNSTTVDVSCNLNSPVFYTLDDGTANDIATVHLHFTGAPNLDIFLPDGMLPSITPKTTASAEPDLDNISTDSLAPPIPPKTHASTLLVNTTEMAGVHNQTTTLTCHEEELREQDESEENDFDSVPNVLLPPRNISRPDSMHPSITPKITAFGEPDLDNISTDSLPPPIPPRTPASTLLANASEIDRIHHQVITHEKVYQQDKDEEDNFELVSNMLLPPCNISRRSATPQSLVEGDCSTSIPVKDNPAYRTHTLRST